MNGFPYGSMLGVNSDYRAPLGHSMLKSQFPPGLKSNHMVGGLSIPGSDTSILLKSSGLNKSTLPIDYPSLDNDLSYLNDIGSKNYDSLFDSFNDMSLKQSNINGGSLIKPQSNGLRKQAITNFSNSYRDSPSGFDELSLSGLLGGSNPFSTSGANHFPSPLIAPPARARANSQSSVDSPPGSPKTLRNNLPLNLSCPEVVRKRTSSDGSMAFDVAEKMAEAVLNATSSPGASLTGIRRDRNESLDSNLSDSSFLAKNMRCLSDENISDGPGSYFK
jgi:hypothetical protein